MYFHFFQRSGFLPSLAAGIVACICITTSVQADHWSDATGKFQIEADYIRVDGKNVVLRKADGSTLSVPIARLSSESRAQAKKLYDMAKSGANAATAPKLSTSATSTSSSYAPQSKYADLVAPAPPRIAAMAPFPNNPTLQEQLDYMKAQILAGHLEVVWYSLPDDLREAIDSQECRETFRPLIDKYGAQGEPIEQIMAKLVEVLTTKKEFVLGSPMLASAPPEVLPVIKQGYDPAVGLVYEYLSLSGAMKAIPDTTVTEIVDYHAPRLGAHLQALVPLLPPGEVDKYLDQIQVQQSDASTGTLTVPSQQGATENIEMVVYSGRWLPKELAEKWAGNKATFISQVQEMARTAEAEAANAQAPDQAAAMIEAVSVQATTVLDGLLAADTQQAFDQTIMQAMGPMMMMFGGGAGGPGGPGFGPGGPGGFGGPPPAGF